ncbi:Central kinetochore subunit-like protein [Hapsidospora chrysogenum ATCC 11550]|uniref:Central kinetochore subunit-like protein n=1 Tax=Hapsidospora chrysogenum (strain ATCC 11550 / CBS 779.69 / DSM 880 / IAM 14645 / JCM 23072 / IMI 49137) TaxID=857340 RepID=A0A086T643_HAPC1|nr:Central kinetochore subunit-like protein [Hapsidospora chrysogenum ATCC 11550]
MARISVATKARLPPTLRVDSANPAVVKSLTRLSRESLLALALDWLSDSAVQNAVPYLRRPPGEDEDDDEDMDDLYPPCRSIDELRQLYGDMQQQKGSKRDVVSRILEGDWRHGLTLYQLAMADFSYIDDHPTSHKWSAFQILPLQQPSQDGGDNEVLRVDRQSLKIPRFHPATFLQNLQEHILPDVKAHYHFYRPDSFPVLLLRIFVVDSPYTTDLALSSLDQTGTAANFDSSRTIYLAFPDGSPSLYITKSQATGPVALGDSKSLQGLIVNGVPKALSRPRERFRLQSTNLSSRNLWALLGRRGPGRTNAAGGGWSIYADDKNKKSPLDSTLPTPRLSRESSDAVMGRKRKASLDLAERERKRSKLIAEARFGESGRMADGRGVEKFEVVLQDPFPPSDAVDESGEEEDHDPTRTNRRRSKVDAVLQQANQNDEDDLDGQGQSSEWTPSLKISFNGTHVFAGIRQLVGAGIINGERMPGWMTGEDCVTTGIVRHGRIRGHKGSGI